MEIKEVLKLEPQKKERYAIVGLGDIAQEDMMPGVKHTGNSEITAPELIRGERLHHADML